VKARERVLAYDVDSFLILLVVIQDKGDVVVAPEWRNRKDNGCGCGCWSGAACDGEAEPFGEREASGGRRTTSELDGGRRRGWRRNGKRTAASLDGV
jgi:hypothetical protein